MQYVLTEEEYKALVPRERYVRTLATSNEYSKKCQAFGAALNEHPDGEKIRRRAIECSPASKEGDSFTARER